MEQSTSYKHRYVKLCITVIALLLVSFAKIVYVLGVLETLWAT